MRSPVFALAATCVLMMAAWPAQAQTAEPDPETRIDAPAEPADVQESEPADVQESMSLPVEPRRPFRGLFGGDPTGADARRSLNLTSTAFGAYDDNLAASLTYGGDPRLLISGGYAGLNLGLDFSSRGDRASFSASGSSAISYYPSFASPLVASYGGGLGFTVPVGQRTTLRASGTLGYSPFYSFNVFPSLPRMAHSDVTVPPPGRDFEAGGSSSVTYGSSVELLRTVSRRTVLAAYYQLNGTDFPDDASTLREQRVGARVTRAFTRDAGVRLGYALREGRYAFGNVPSKFSHDIDAGLDYGRTLSLSRRTRLSFRTGSSIVVTEGNSGTSESVPPGEDLHVVASGVGSLDREIGRTWNARWSFERGLRFVQGFDEPFLSNATSVGMSGYASRRVDLTWTASYSSGAVGFSTVNNDFTTAALTARVRTAVTRRLGAFAEYLYYRYKFDSAVALPTGFAPALNRQGVRIGLTTWVPLMRRTG